MLAALRCTPMDFNFDRRHVVVDVQEWNILRKATCQSWRRWCNNDDALACEDLSLLLRLSCLPMLFAAAALSNLSDGTTDIMPRPPMHPVAGRRTRLWIECGRSDNEGRILPVPHLSSTSVVVAETMMSFRYRHSFWTVLKGHLV